MNHPINLLKRNCFKKFLICKIQSTNLNFKDIKTNKFSVKITSYMFQFRSKVMNMISYRKSTAKMWKKLKISYKIILSISKKFIVKDLNH